MLGPEPCALRHRRWFDDFVDDATGILRSLHEVEDYLPDEPSFVYYRTDVAPTAALSDGGYPYLPANGGRGLSGPMAEIRALFEGLERYSLSLYRRANFVVASWAALQRDGTAALDPAALMTDGQPANAVRTAPLAWCRGRSELDEEVLAPAQSVYLPYRFGPGEPTLRQPLTTGAAAGLSGGAALRRALQEVIERDATMIAHYRRRAVRRIPPSLVDDAPARGMLNELTAHGIQAELFDFTTDLGMPVIVARIRGDGVSSPGTVMGSSADLDVSAAIRSALLEAACYRRPLRPLMKTFRERAEPVFASGEPISSLALRGAAWSRPELSDQLEYLDQAPPADSLPAPPAGGLAGVLERIREINGPLVWFDVAAPSVRAAGVHVVKVVAPALQPMHLDERRPAWTRRLLEYGGARVAIADLNPVPHPFL